MSSIQTVYFLWQGCKSSHALSEAMKVVQSSRTFSHPSNWASWMLIGADVRLSSKVALMGHALCELLKAPAKSREAMRVVLHLVSACWQLHTLHSLLFCADNYNYYFLKL